mmetsp:Transcript_79920/g.247969  ORF Transcript_79920/g.247969 Transcript_79920/m.247969 type:complete len:232 (-) Transcript_79920:173-868(-)
MGLRGPHLAQGPRRGGGGIVLDVHWEAVQCFEMDRDSLEVIDWVADVSDEVLDYVPGGDGSWDDGHSHVAGLPGSLGSAPTLPSQQGPLGEEAEEGEDKDQEFDKVWRWITATGSDGTRGVEELDDVWSGMWAPASPPLAGTRASDDEEPGSLIVGGMQAVMNPMGLTTSRRDEAFDTLDGDAGEQVLEPLALPRVGRRHVRRRLHRRGPVDEESDAGIGPGAATEQAGIG